jgi:hypothetical protein
MTLNGYSLIAPHQRERGIPYQQNVSYVHPVVTNAQLHLKMLSSRGQTYARLNLAAGYLRESKPLYNKSENPDGLVSMSNAENVILPWFKSLYIVSQHDC